MFILVVVILTLVYIIVFDGVSPFITTLLSFVITLSVSYNDGDDCDGLLVALNIKPGVCDLDGYNPDAYNLPI